MKTFSLHISNVLHKYFISCNQSAVHEFVLHPERIYFGLSNQGIHKLSNIPTLDEIIKFPYVVVCVPGELSVIRIHALHFGLSKAEKAYVLDDSTNDLTDVEKTMLSSTIATAIYQFNGFPHVTTINF